MLLRSTSYSKRKAPLFLISRIPCKSMSSLNDQGSGSRSVPPGHKLITEGQASITFNESNEVFYNKVQVFNRDLSIHVIKYFAEVRMQEKAEERLKKGRKSKTPFTPEELAVLNKKNWSEICSQSSKDDGIVILDALAATALRSIRYVKEIPGVKKVVANDLDLAAVEAARRNSKFNDVDESMLDIKLGDATNLMYQSRDIENQFDVIDLDPYGSAVPFIDAAVQSIRSGGLICVTCTDMPVLSGGKPDTCYMKYGSMPTKGKYVHEMSLRILLNCLSNAASKYKRHVIPLLSLSIDFYIRVFVRVYDSPKEAKNACSKLGYVLQSTGCPSFTIQPMSRPTKNEFKAAYLCENASICPQTGSNIKIGGPIWIDPIYDEKWVLSLLERIKVQQEKKDANLPATANRIASLLTTVSEELFDVPLYYNLSEICSVLHCNAPSRTTIRSAIINAGYRISAQHKDPYAIKTDAPDHILWDIMRCWIKKQPISQKRLDSNSVCNKILSIEPKHEANFALTRGSILEKITRFHQNPEPNWGPMKRATGKKRPIEEENIENNKKEKIGANSTGQSNET